MERNEILGIYIAIFIAFIIIFTFATLLLIIAFQKKKMIEFGMYDENIKAENIRETKISYQVLKKLNAIFSIVFCSILIVIFGISLYGSLSNNNFLIPGVAHAQVVVSDSMSKKHENNNYLIENNLNNQFQVYDIIFTYELPKEEDLQLYDVVVYEIDGQLVVHRIVFIEEPNKDHPNERHFYLRGDASSTSDRDYVVYSQMRGIYKGTSIPFVGIFVLFFQSTLGYISLGIVLMYCIATPIIERMLYNAAYARAELLYLESRRRRLY